MGRATRGQAPAVASRVSRHPDQVPAVRLQSPRPEPWTPHGRWQGLPGKPRDSDLDLGPPRRQGSRRGRRTQEASRLFPPPARTLPKAALAPESPAEARCTAGAPSPRLQGPSSTSGSGIPAPETHRPRPQKPVQHCRGRESGPRQPSPDLRVLATPSFRGGTGVQRRCPRAGGGNLGERHGSGEHEGKGAKVF